MADTCEHWTGTEYAKATIQAACPWCHIKILQVEVETARTAAADIAREAERLRKVLSQRLQQLDEIRDASLTWAMACEHHCPACDALYEVIRGQAK